MIERLLANGLNQGRWARIFFEYLKHCSLHLDKLRILE